MTVQGTFIFLAGVKVLLKGEKTLGSVCPISGFPVFSPAVREETHLKVPAALLPPGFLRTPLPWGSLDHGQFGNCCSDCFWAGGGSTGIHTVGGAATVFGLLFVLLFLLSWLRKANTLSSVSVGDVCA